MQIADIRTGVFANERKEKLFSQDFSNGMFLHKNFFIFPITKNIISKKKNSYAIILNKFCDVTPNFSLKKKIS